MRELCIGLFLISLVTASASRSAIFISPSGNDINSGTYNAPLKTLKAALPISRSKNIKTIYLRGGRYFDVSIDFLPVDSGLTIRNYGKECPVLYGGIILKDLQKENHLVCADLSGNKKISDFRMIIVNDSLRERSRIPEKKFSKLLNVWNAEMLPGVYGGWSRQPTLQELSEMRYSPNDFESWKEDTASAEISLMHRWNESYLKVQSVDTLQQIIHFTYPATNVPGSFNNKEYIVWNVRNGLKHPGQWYWNKTNRKLYYWPYKEEGNKQIEIIIPTTRCVLNFTEGVKNVTIKGLSIKAAGNLLQNEAFASKDIDAAIDGRKVSNISIKDTWISQCSGSGIRLRGNNCTLENVRIDKVGGSGIFTIGNDANIKNCTIKDVGTIFLSSVGVYSYGKKNTIQTSQISNIPYSGICFFGDSCVVSHCKIENAMTTMEDGGFIYGGIQKGGLINDNVVIGYNRKIRSVGLYLDEQSESTTIRNNLVYHCVIPVQCNLAKNSNFSNNVFWDSSSQKINYQRSFDLNFNNNIFIAELITFDGPSVLDARVDTNLLELKYRKYANPTGITCFRKNQFFIYSTSSQKQLLPIVPTNELLGSNIQYVPFKTFQSADKFVNEEKISKLHKKIRCLFLKLMSYFI